MQRKAVVVGVSKYSKQDLGNFASFTNNANAIADILEPTFTVKRLPDVVEGDRVRVGKNGITFDRLKTEIKHLFTATDLYTVLFYFSGHGLRGQQFHPKTYLATTESEKYDDGYRKSIEIDTIKQFLKDCPAREQIVWLDCCYGGDLVDFRELVEQNDGKTRLIITASRQQEIAYQEIAGEMGAFTRVLVEALARMGDTERRITCASIEDAVREKLRSLPYPQMPQFYRTPNKVIEFWDRQAISIERNGETQDRQNIERIKHLEDEINSMRSLQETNIDKRFQNNKKIVTNMNEIEKLKKSLRPEELPPKELKITKINLAKIDFTEARRQISPRCQSLEEQGGFLELIIEKCHNYKGNLLIDEIRDRFSNGKPNFKSIIIDPKSGMWTDNQGWMLNIAECLKIPSHEISLSPEILVNTIIQQCCSGRTFFFELQNLGVLEDCQVDLLTSFYDSFWEPLKAKRAQIIERGERVRFISIVSDGGLLDSKFVDLNCQSIKIDLCTWTEPEIRNWLMEYVSFPSDDDRSREARRIFLTSEGLPLSIFADLQERFCFT